MTELEKKNYEILFAIRVSANSIQRVCAGGRNDPVFETDFFEHVRQSRLA